MTAGPRGVARPRPAVLLPLLVAGLAGGCRPSVEDGGSASAPRPARFTPPSVTASAAPTQTLLEVPKPARGLKLTLSPNLPGVSEDDLPVVARRHVEVLSYDGATLRLRWTASVKVERPETARQREDWVRARTSNAPGRKPPATPAAAEYEDREVGGTLTFPDTRTARQLLLPGLWPEGDVTIREATALWLPEKAERDLVEAGLAHVPLLSDSPLLAGPAAGLLARATALMDEEAGKDPSASPPDLWRIASRDCRVSLRVSGRLGDVEAVRASNWFGSYEVLPKAGGSLVLSVLPSPPSSPTFDLFSPGNVLRTMLGYRVIEVEGP